MAVIRTKRIERLDFAKQLSQFAECAMCLAEQLPESSERNELLQKVKIAQRAIRMEGVLSACQVALRRVSVDLSDVSAKGIDPMPGSRRRPAATLEQARRLRVSDRQFTREKTYSEEDLLRFGGFGEHRNRSPGRRSRQASAERRHEQRYDASQNEMRHERHTRRHMKKKEDT